MQLSRASAATITAPSSAASYWRGQKPPQRRCRWSSAAAAGETPASAADGRPSRPGPARASIASSRRMVRAMRLRGASTSSTFTLTTSPGFTTVARVLDEGLRHRRDVHEPVLVHADIDEGAEGGDVGDHAFQHHAGLQIGELLDALLEGGGLEGRARVAARLFQLLQDVGHGRHAEAARPRTSLGDRPAQNCGVADEDAHVAPWSPPGSAGPPDRLRDARPSASSGSSPSRNAQEAGALLEGLGAEARHLLQRRAGLEGGRWRRGGRRCCSASASPRPETRASSGAEAVLRSTPTRVDAILDHRVERAARA